LIVQKENGDFEAKVFSALGEYAENINVSGECAKVIFLNKEKTPTSTNCRPKQKKIIP
jgi:hypothetical protein